LRVQPTISADNGFTGDAVRDDVYVQVVAVGDVAQLIERDVVHVVSSVLPGRRGSRSTLGSGERNRPPVRP
jgi:hypothetical protein